MFIMSNHDGRKYICILIQFEPCNDMLKVISSIMAHLHELKNTFLITINFCNAKKMLFMIENYNGT